MKKNSRFTLRFPDEFSDEIREMKKTQYYDRPFADLFRDIMRAGLDQIKKQAKTA